MITANRNDFIYSAAVLSHHGKKRAV